MMDASRRYTATEADLLKAQGYEFQEVTRLGDPEPMYAVKGHKPPEEPRGLSEHNAAGWERT